MRPKLTNGAALVVASSVALLFIFGVYLSASSDRYAVLPAMTTSAWRAGSGSLHLKNTSDGTSDLLLMSLGRESGYAIRDWPNMPAKNLTDRQPVYRYVAADRKLVEVPPETWDISTGEISDFVSQGPRLTNFGTFTHDLNTRLLQFNGKVVPTAGPTVLEAQPDPTETYVAVLSAEGKL